MVLQKKRALKYPVKIAIVATGTGTAAQRGIFTYDKSGARVLVTLTAGTNIATLIASHTGTGN